MTYSIDYNAGHEFFDLTLDGVALAALPTLAVADDVRRIHAAGGAWQRATGDHGGIVAQAARMWARPGSGEGYAGGVRRWRAARAAMFQRRAA